MDCENCMKCKIEHQKGVVDACKTRLKAAEIVLEMMERKAAIEGETDGSKE